MLKELEIEKAIAKRIEAVLSEIPFIRVVSVRSQSGRLPDIQVDLFSGDRNLRLLIEVKTIGDPRLVRSAIQLIEDALRDQDNTYGMVGSSYISPASAQLCRENNIGYIDLAGNCLISFDRIFIKSQNYSNADSEKRTARTIFSPRSSRVLRVLLNNTGKAWQVQELAKEARISIGLASRLKDRLLDLEYLRGENKMIIVNNPLDLLNKWVDNYSYQANKVYDYFSFDNPKLTEQKLAAYCNNRNIPYALALFSGAALVAPVTRYNRGFAYVKADPDELSQALELNKVDSGPNFSILQPYDDGVFYGCNTIEGFSVVSDIQLYLDLASYKGRGEEAAKFLFEQRIRPRW